MKQDKTSRTHGGSFCTSFARSHRLFRLGPETSRKVNSLNTLDKSEQVITWQNGQRLMWPSRSSKAIGSSCVIEIRLQSKNLIIIWHSCSYYKYRIVDFPLWIRRQTVEGWARWVNMPRSFALRTESKLTRGADNCLIALIAGDG